MQKVDNLEHNQKAKMINNLEFNEDSYVKLSILKDTSYTEGDEEKNEPVWTGRKPGV